MVLSYKTKFDLSTNLEQGKGTQFDQKIAEAFIEILKDYEAIREEIAWTFEETALDLEHR